MLSHARRSLARLGVSPHVRQCRRAHLTSRSSTTAIGLRSCGSRVPISPDTIVVETIVEEETFARFTHGGEHASASHAAEEIVRESTVHDTSGFCDVTTVDTFARGRVANYLRRMGHPPSQAYQTRRLAEHEKITLIGASSTTGASHGVEVFHAQVKVPLPAPHGSYLAEGLAETAKDAELLAAMHAQYVCDALGVPLYSLPSMQRKHAEAARRAGRHAPLPGDPVRSEGTAVPPPLRMLTLAVRGEARRTGRGDSGGEPSSTSFERVDHMLQGATKADPDHSHHFAPSIAEAELVAEPRDVPASSPAISSSTHPLTAHTTTSTQRLRPVAARTPRRSANAWEAPEHTSPAHTRPDTAKEREDGDISAERPTDADATASTLPLSSSLPSGRSSHASWRYADVAWYPWCHTRTPQEVLAEEGEDDLPLDELLNMVGGLGHSINPGASPSAQSPSSPGTGSRAPHQPPPARARQTPTSTARAAPFDPTEGGLWQMSQPLSTRCSPCPEDALVLPYVYDGPHSLARVRAYYDQHGVPLETCLTMTHVSVARHAGRMYVAELRLVDVHNGLTAKGKAQTKEIALHLAAMHAELLLDAMGRPLFPKDPARQHRHAEAVKRFGRWAYDPLSTETTVTTAAATTTENARKDGTQGPRPAQMSSGALSVAGLDGDALPLPLKQQVGGDDVWLNLVRPPSTSYARSDGEHIVALHNVINHHYSDAIEVHMPSDVLERAPEILRQWQLTVAENVYPEMYVLTRLGDAYRATTITPVPRCYGVRGGNAIGKSMQQAVQLCALHALDTLCALGIPIYADPIAQREYMAWRRAHGFVTPDRVRGLRRPAFVVPLKHSIIPAPGEVEMDANDDDDDHDRDDTDDATAFPTSAEEASSERARTRLPAFVKDALRCTPGQVPSTRRPYLPSYIAEGHVVRLPPRIADTLCVMQLDIPEHFNVFGCAEDNDAVRVEMGNAARVCVQNYIQHQHAAYSAALRQHQQTSPPSSQQEQSEGESQPKQPASLEERSRHFPSSQTADIASVCMAAPSPEEARLWWRHWLSAPPLTTPHVFITGYTKQISVYNFAYLRIPLPLSHVTLKTLTSDSTTHAAPPSVLALGLALKKKDAERMCFVHAAAMLHALADEDVLQRYPTGLPRQGVNTSYVKHIRPHITTPTGAATEAETNAHPPTEASISHTAYGRPIMYATMKTFLGSGKYYVPPRRRNGQGEAP